MPHLSPLNWILAPILFWLLLSSFASILWWSQTTHFPQLSSSFPLPPKSQWTW